MTRSPNELFWTAKNSLFTLHHYSETDTYHGSLLPGKFADIQQVSLTKVNQLVNKLGGQFVPSCVHDQPCCTEQPFDSRGSGRGVRYLVEKDWVKGKDNSSHSPFSQSYKSFACRTFGKEACLILLPPPVNWENLAYTKKSEQSLYLRQAVTMSSYGV